MTIYPFILFFFVLNPTLYIRTLNETQLPTMFMLCSGHVIYYRRISVRTMNVSINFYKTHSNKIIHLAYQHSYICVHTYTLCTLKIIHRNVALLYSYLKFLYFVFSENSIPHTIYSVFKHNKKL